MAEEVDVVIIGAGFAGLAAARQLARTGLDVLVLEGRDRVGGRSWTQATAGIPLDLGATFVGPGQDAVLELARELGVATTPTYCAGNNVIHWRGKLRSYRGTVPKLSPATLANLGWVRWQLARLTRDVPIDAPWKAPEARRLDAMSLRQWLVSVRAAPATHDLMAIAARVTWGAEPDDVSMLHVLRYVKAAGGLDRMLDVTGGAQQDRFPGGTQEIAEKMAAELGDRVRLSTLVDRIIRDERGVRVRCGQPEKPAGDDENCEVNARTAIIAIPPQHRAAIEFSPALPAEYQRLMRCWPQGRLSKAYAVYEYPFWRIDGRSGEGLSDTGPVFITFDVSPSPAGPGVLLGFVDPRNFDELEPGQRREAALAGFASLFGERARHPVAYVDHSWGGEEFAPGGPTAAVPTGSWTGVGPWLRKPLGPIFWAGTETADEWTGFLDGAVRSGYRAADEAASWLARPD